MNSNHRLRACDTACLLSLLRHLLVVVALVALPASTTFADDAREDDRGGVNHQWGMSIWGLSYHVNRTIDYNENNWGLGLRYYIRPKWRWLGKSEDHRVFFEADALRNSYRGLVVPLSAGAEVKIRTLSDGCSLLAVGTLTLAYYHNPMKNTTDLMFGPVPGFAIGCGHVKFNTVAVLRASNQPLAAVVEAMTIVF